MTITPASQRALDAHTQKRREHADARIQQAIKRLRRRGAAINISTVAREAGVSRSVIHRRPELRRQINAVQPLEALPDELPPPAPSDIEGSIIAALRTRLKAKDAHIADLKAQLREKDTIIATLHGELACRPPAD
ncbi:transposase [Mycobacteroides abscessus subsp. abscessus]|uniref:DUF6262 family protein n=1 Tax=Mycobacteroides abscessus TaxID=36809 RepID=UPI000926F713|nr:DUF6262 family protein [Mycobacteroides abscessus]MBN7413089.1 transposase [Mycobacteroides abscessus subsp. abscessus]MDM2350140.1 DUF6262 family protein [Mycobacteroides abscessus]MDM2360588.1 DUF6262 family protein [Mycobacteroides abscessus]QSN52752.1 transposase [Mycobacteroides abscessus subsp. abscessus]QSN53126.1 transposase [Mycobacteroides abscessus subsp. abscessus]